MTPDPDRAEVAIAALLAARGPDKTICPSEAARLLSPEAWRDEMPRVHEAAARLAASGAVVRTQGGEPVRSTHIEGPYRIAAVR